MSEEKKRSRSVSIGIRAKVRVVLKCLKDTHSGPAWNNEKRHSVRILAY